VESKQNYISLAEAEKTNLMEILVFGEANRMMDTHYGRITHKGWCEREAKRITDKGTGRTTQLVRRGSEVALFVDRVANIEKH
jgi:hypothetical protein